MKTTITILTIISNLTILGLHADSYLKEDLIGDEKPIFLKMEESSQQEVNKLLAILQSDLFSLEEREEALRQLVCMGVITIKLELGQNHE